jgi:hypothetical protein
VNAVSPGLQNAADLIFSESGLGEELLAHGAAIPLSMVLTHHANAQSNQFLVDGIDISPEVFFAPEVFLPAIVWEAQLMGTRLLGADLGCRLRVDPSGLLGVTASVPFVTGNLADIMRALLCLHAVNSCCGNSKEMMVEMGMIVDAYKNQFAAMASSAELKDGELKWPQRA